MNSLTPISTLKLSNVHANTDTLEMLADEAVLDDVGCNTQKRFPYLKVHPIGNFEFIVEIDEESFEACDRDNVPENLRSLIEVTLEFGCELLFIVEDGNIYPELPKYYD